MAAHDPTLMPDTLAQTMRDVDRFLADYYEFDLTFDSSKFLFTSEAAPYSDSTAEVRPRGEVLVVTEPDTLNIGVRFHPDIRHALESEPPLARLSSSNLDAFCVVVEEVSHVHLLINRANRGLQVSQVELEWQGEIDKLLVSATVLASQCGSAHVLPLARMLYDMASVSSPDHAERYWNATKYAARFWFQRIATAPDADQLINCDETRLMLRENYRAEWSEKTSRISSLASGRQRFRFSA